MELIAFVIQFQMKHLDMNIAVVFYFVILNLFYAS